MSFYISEQTCFIHDVCFVVVGVNEWIKHEYMNAIYEKISFRVVTNERLLTVVLVLSVNASLGSRLKII